MTPPYHWVSEEAARAIHRRQIAEHGGMDGIRDAGLLSSALAKPQNLNAYRPEADVCALAAAYGAGITGNHPFLDGNKRTGYIVMRLFLKLNGFDINASQEDKYRVMMKLAAGTLSEDELGDWLRTEAQALLGEY